MLFTTLLVDLSTLSASFERSIGTNYSNTSESGK